MLSKNQKIGVIIIAVFVLCLILFSVGYVLLFKGVGERQNPSASNKNELSPDAPPPGTLDNIYRPLTPADVLNQ